MVLINIGADKNKTKCIHSKVFGRLGRVRGVQGQPPFFARASFANPHSDRYLGPNHEKFVLIKDIWMESEQTREERMKDKASNSCRVARKMCIKKTDLKITTDIYT
jgi:hypothetical protein